MSFDVHFHVHGSRRMKGAVNCLEIGSRIGVESEWLSVDSLSKCSRNDTFGTAVISSALL